MQGRRQRCNRVFLLVPIRAETETAVCGSGPTRDKIQGNVVTWTKAAGKGALVPISIGTGRSPSI
jgi:hypothetical protein